MKRNPKLALLASVGLGWFSSPAWAIQTDVDQPEDVAASAAQDAAAPDGGDGTIVVTGSRIVRDGYTAPTPVTVATTEDLVRATPSNIPDAINKLPQFQLSSSPSRSTHNFANSAAHGNVLNLRGVGGNRTLILFDGIRVPPTTYRGEVDVNVIPNLLIERVEVVTAGASAAYGSDAVAGVVNFVLDRDFTGIRGVAQMGISERSDNRNYRLGIAGGTELFGGAGHALFSAEYYNNEGMRRSDRASGRVGYLAAGRAPGAGAPGSAANPFVIYTDSRSTVQSEGGLAISGPFAGQRFLPDGTLTPFNPGTPTGTPGFSVGGDGFRIPFSATAVAAQETLQLFGRLEYEFSPSLTAFVQGNFTRSDVNYFALANALAAPTAAPIFSDNAFLRPELRDQLINAGVNSFNISQYFGDAAGPNRTEERTDFWMVTAGLEGRIGQNWRWDASYTHGSSEHNVRQFDLFSFRNIYAALDAVVDPASGNIVCRPTLDSDPTIRARYQNCVPFNIQGFRAYSPEAWDYVTDTSAYDAFVEQDSFAVNLQGSLFELPAGPLDVAIGAEYRRQKLRLVTNADPALLDTPEERNDYFAGLRGVSPSALFFFVTNVGSANGSISVKEGFVEVNVPILRDVPFFNSLELNGAARITDYSTSGTVYTWKGGATWRPIPDVLFRATRSRDIRAPALFDLFAGDQFGIGTLIDPVSGQTGNVAQITGGNPNLEPEIADTFAIGAVVSPSFLPGFSMSIDYFNLEIDAAIGTLSITQIVQNCAASGGTAPECALVSRPSPNEFPTGARIAPANIAFLQTRGIDFDASYRTRLGNGELNLRLYATYLDSFRTQQSATAPIIDFAGRGTNVNQPIGRPKWRGTLNVNYTVNDFSLFVSQQYIGPLRLGSDEPNQIWEDPNVGAVWYTDLTLSQRLAAFGGDVEMFLTINNLFDRDPPLVPGSIPALNLPTIISLYDTVGRTYTVGARFRF